MKTALIVGGVLVVLVGGYYLVQANRSTTMTQEQSRTMPDSSGQNPTNAVFGFLTELARTSGAVISLVDHDRQRTANRGT